MTIFSDKHFLAISYYRSHLLILPLGLLNPENKGFKTASAKCPAQSHPKQLAYLATLL
jgi:hypothetical protein